MNTAVRLAEPILSLALPTSRGGLSGWLRRQCAETGAEFYMLIALPSSGGQSARIVASNWSYDTVEFAGHDALTEIAAARPTRFCGERPAAWDLVYGERVTRLRHDQIMALCEAGHREIVSTRLNVGSDRFCVIFSAGRIGSLDEDAIRVAVVRLSYALARVSAELAPPLAEDPLTERERECLYWVAEGKTSEEVSTIVGVSVNTVTSYVVQAIRRLSASNRTMAVATAIRAGFI